MKALRLIGVLFVVPLIILCGSLPFLEQTLIGRWEKQHADSWIRLLNPFFDKPQTAFVESWLLGQQVDSSLVAEAAKQATSARPLSGLNWLNRAKVELRLGDKMLAEKYAYHAETLAPTRAQHLWNLAMLWLKMGNVDEYFRLIRTYLIAKPNDVNKVLTLSYRLQADPEKLLASIFPTIELSKEETDKYLYQVISFAIRSKNQPLASVVWKQILGKNHEEVKQPYLISSYFNFLVSTNFVDEAMQFWEETMGDVSPFERIYNNGFESALVNFGFGWKAQKIKGSIIDRDSSNKIEGDYSLSVKLDGSENINLYTPSVTVPVKPNGTYEITAYWKGDSISTRSNPYLQIYSSGAEKNSSARTEAKRGSWDWQRIKLQLTMPHDSALLNIRLLRNKTNALDKNISGQIWLDDFEIKRVQE